MVAANRHHWGYIYRQTVRQLPLVVAASRNHWGLEFSTVSASVTNRRLVKNEPNSTLEVTLLGPVFVVRLITRLESSALKYQEVKLTRTLINRPSCQPSADRSEPAWSSGKTLGW